MEKKNSTVDSAYQLIVDKILDMSLKPGEVVTEFLIAEKFGIGRTPVREAMKRLESEGLIQVRNRTRVVQNLQIKDIEDIFDIKILLEPAVARQAAETGTDSQRARLSEIIGSMMEYRSKIEQGHAGKREDLLEEWLVLDRAFHALLFEMAGNEKITKIIANLNLQWHRFKVALVAIEDRIEKALDEHYTIGMAIVNGDSAGAEKAMYAHLDSLKRVLVTLMKAFVYN